MCLCVQACACACTGEWLEMVENGLRGAGSCTCPCVLSVQLSIHGGVDHVRLENPSRCCMCKAACYTEYIHVCVACAKLHATSSIFLCELHVQSCMLQLLGIATMTNRGTCCTFEFFEHQEAQQGMQMQSAPHKLHSPSHAKCAIKTKQLLKLTLMVFLPPLPSCTTNRQTYRSVSVIKRKTKWGTACTATC